MDKLLSIAIAPDWESNRGMTSPDKIGQNDESVPFLFTKTDFSNCDKDVGAVQSVIRDSKG